MGGIVKFIGTALIVIIAILAGLWAWLGGFSKIVVTKGEFSPTTIVYATHKGPYEQIGGTWRELIADLDTSDLPECDAIALYLDPPDSAPEDLRSVLGCRIDGYTDEQMAALGARPTVSLPRARTVTASFPFKFFASYFVAPVKVYPAMTNADLGIDEEPVLAIEVYGPESAMTEIVFHLPYGIEKSAYAELYNAF